jgi:diadenosine tetraphosphate (Ap4A) HIT family hydrolase
LIKTEGGMVHSSPCLSCRTLAGEVQPPGGIIYNNSHWVVFLRSRPLLTPGQGFIVLKRHCEDVASLTPEEAATLGEVMRRAAMTYTHVLAAERVHFGLYAEEIRHIHLHVLPRTRALPAGNIPTTLLGVWYAVLQTLRLRHSCSDDEVADVADSLRQHFAQLDREVG